MTKTKTQNSIKDISLYSKHVPWPLIKWEGKKKKTIKSILKYFQRPVNRNHSQRLLGDLSAVSKVRVEKKAKMMSFPKTFHTENNTMNTSFQLPNSPPSPSSLTVVCEKSPLLYWIILPAFSPHLPFTAFSKIIELYFLHFLTCHSLFCNCIQALIMCSDPTEPIQKRSLRSY